MMIPKQVTDFLAKTTSKVAQNSGKILTGVLSAAITALVFAIREYFMKRKLHKKYYKKGFDEGVIELGDNLMKEIKQLKEDKIMSDKEKLKKLKKYHDYFKKFEALENSFIENYDKCINDQTLSDSEKEEVLNNLMEQHRKKLITEGFIS